MYIHLKTSLTLATLIETLFYKKKIKDILVLMSIPFPIIKFTASTKAIRSKYIFISWNYTMTTVCLIFDKFLLYTNIISLYYLDKAYGITIIDFAYLLKKTLTEKILK